MVAILIGYIPLHAISRFTITGSVLTDFLARVLLVERNVASKRETVVEVKEKLSIVPH